MLHQCSWRSSSASALLQRRQHSIGVLVPKPTDRVVLFKQSLTRKQPGLIISPCRSSTRTAASAGSHFNPVEVVKREAGLQSNKLEDNVRERVERSIEALGYRVTVGDVAARAGVNLAQADEALKALAYDSLGTLEVSNEGDVVYAFPRNFRASLRNKSLTLRAKGWWQKAQGALNYLVRITFGTALIASVALVWFAILAITSSSRDDRDNRRGGGYGYYNDYNAYRSTRLALDLTDLFIYWDPYYYRNTQQRIQAGQELSFIESIFSFVFGDGDPNMNFEERRWQALGNLIQSKGGVVTAEEMAPFLDPPQNAAQEGGTYVDEGFVLPALIKFGGEPIVNDKGHLLYMFPSLQRTSANLAFAQPPSYEVPLEKPRNFTASSAGQIFGTVALGALNLVGVAVLSSLLTDPQARIYAIRQGLGFITNLMPALQVYAFSFFAIPAVRWFFNTAENKQIDERNEARVSATNKLNNGLRLGGTVAEKAQAARKAAKGQQKFIRKQDTVFTTDRDVAQQMNQQDVDDWEGQLSGRSGSSAGAGRGANKLPERAGNERWADVFQKEDGSMLVEQADDWAGRSSQNGKSQVRSNRFW